MSTRTSKFDWLFSGPSPLRHGLSRASSRYEHRTMASGLCYTDLDPSSLLPTDGIVGPIGVGVTCHGVGKPEAKQQGGATHARYLQKVTAQVRIIREPAALARAAVAGSGLACTMSSACSTASTDPAAAVTSEAMIKVALECTMTPSASRADAPRTLVFSTTRKERTNWVRDAHNFH
jgi:hypothetical protein